MLPVFIPNEEVLTSLIERLSLEHHWLTEGLRCPSPHQSVRLKETISLIVLHCISLPAGHFANRYVPALFTGTLSTKEHADFADLEGVKVSAHVLIRREGTLLQFVPFDQAAWHAGVSSYRGQSGCNEFSIGIELEGTEHSSYTDQQYQALVPLIQLLQKGYSIPEDRVVGHADIAPGRKTDPGPGFDWDRFWRQLQAR